MMKYQLVLLFAAASMQDFDRLVALEGGLIEELDDVATVATLVRANSTFSAPTPSKSGASGTGDSSIVVVCW